MTDLPLPSLRARATVAALFVDADGCYVGLPDVDPWPEARDARTYAGPHPVVAHPPCQRWGRLWRGNMRRGCKVQRLGDDGGCFAAALAAVRRWGGVLEHPEASAAWRTHGLIPPPRRGGWVAAGDWRGYTCCVEQGHYGHRARKATWLYACGVDLPLLTWGPSEQTAYLTAPRSVRSGRRVPVALMGHRERRATPLPFRDLLLSIARSAYQRRQRVLFEAAS